MFNNKKYRGMEESIIQFNKITGNPECAVSMNYLIHFNWNANEAAKAYLSMHGYGNSPANEFDIEYKRYKPKFEKKRIMQNVERSTELMQRKYKMSIIKNEERTYTIKKSKSNNHFDDIQQPSTSKVKFDLNKSEEMPRDVCSRTFKIPKGILKFKKMESSEINEEDESTPFRNIPNYELTTKASSVFSSEKEIPEIVKQVTFRNISEFNPESIEVKHVSKFGEQED